MIQKKIICDRCNEVIFDSESKLDDDPNELVNVLFGINSEKYIGHAEMNVIRSDGSFAHTVHLCMDCYDIAVKALNKKRLNRPMWSNAVTQNKVNTI